MPETNWSDFDGDAHRVCLGCGHRSRLDVGSTVTDQPGCPECGYSTADSLTEMTASGWNENERLISARLEVEIWSYRNPEGIHMGWLKEQVDEFLKVLIAAELDTTSKLSGAPASEYMGIGAFTPWARPDGEPTGPDAGEPDVFDLTGREPGTIGDAVREFLDQIRGRRASGARGVFQQWEAEEHKN